MNSSCAWEFSLCPFWINECILAWIRPVMPCQERMLPSFRSLHHYTRWWSIPQFSCENKEVCTLMHRKFLMGIQSVLTIIYKNQVGGNLVHKHKKIKIWREGRTDTAKHIQISWADFPIRISDVSDKCLVYYWQLDTYILQYFTCCSFDFLLKGGKVLARYEISAREFLYPTPTLTGKDGVERELLLSRTVHFTVSWNLSQLCYYFSRLKTRDMMVFPHI